MWPDWVNYWPLGNFIKPLAKINLPKLPTFLGNFCRGVKIYHFSSDIIFWATFIDNWLIFSGRITLSSSDPGLPQALTWAPNILVWQPLARVLHWPRGGH